MPGQEGKRNGRSRKTVRLGAAALVALSGVAGYQAVAATATLPIIARLIRAIVVTVNTTMDFGTLAMTADRVGKATIDPALNKLFIDNGSSLSLAGGKPAAGRLTIRGAEYPVAVSVGDTLVKMTNGKDTVTVSGFNLVSLKGGTKMTFTPAENTYTFTIPVGATIKTREGQISGTYVGATHIFANYQ